jgi:hypothetical protein
MGRQDEMKDAVRPLMAAMAQGCSDSLFDLLERCTPDLEKMVVGILCSLNRRDIARSPDHVSSLVISAGFVLFDRAGGWRSDGALPWVYAYRSIREAIVKDVGHALVDVDVDTNVADTSAVSSGDAVIDLRDMATRFDEVAAWIEAVESVANERDRHVHLEYQVQKRLGDPSPANTVAAMFSLSPANVRQIDRRVRQRLEDSPFAELRFIEGLYAA